ncbi:Chitin synthase, class 2, partial [Rhizoclosmatium hyalinum]
MSNKNEHRPSTRSEFEDADEEGQVEAIYPSKPASKPSAAVTDPDSRYASVTSSLTNIAPASVYDQPPKLLQQLLPGQVRTSYTASDQPLSKQQAQNTGSNKDLREYTMPPPPNHPPPARPTSLPPLESQQRAAKDSVTEQQQKPRQPAPNLVNMKKSASKSSLLNEAMQNSRASTGTDQQQQQQSQTHKREGSVKSNSPERDARTRDRSDEPKQQPQQHKREASVTSTASKSPEHEAASAQQSQPLAQQATQSKPTNGSTTTVKRGNSVKFSTTALKIEYDNQQDPDPTSPLPPPLPVQDAWKETIVDIPPPSSQQDPDPIQKKATKSALKNPTTASTNTLANAAVLAQNHVANSAGGGSESTHIRKPSLASSYPQPEPLGARAVPVMASSETLPDYTNGSRRSTIVPVENGKFVVQVTVSAKNGKFVVQVTVSAKVSAGMKFEKEDGWKGAEIPEEFDKLRYTAVTCDPNKFVEEEYKIRPMLYNRKIRMAIVITMYNEDDVLFCKSFRAIQKNIAYLCSGRANWTPDAWKEILIVIVSDGRTKVNPTVLDVMKILGLYMDGLIQTKVDNKDVTAHMFEYTIQANMDKELERKGPNDTDEGIVFVPVQTMFLLKEKNAKKINSHRWFFNAICESIQPEVCILLDVGTKPTKESLFHLYNAFHWYPEVGGACGEIAAEPGKYLSNFINPLVAVQNFEYKMSNILDKPLESVLGYISVLPGAFSAYRYEALKGEPLKCYFHGETSVGESVSEANMYLAEDRILCFELVMKKDKSWLLKYVKSARAETDVPSELHDLISQRRRWLNGSFFAALYATYNWQRIGTSTHQMGRKWMLYFEFLYNAVGIFFQWFNIGNFYLSFYFLFGASNTTSVSGSDPFYPNGAIVFNVINQIYLMTLVTAFILALGNRPAGSKWLYFYVAVSFACLMFMMLFMAIWTVTYAVRDFQSSGMGFVSYAGSTPSFRDIVISMVTVYGVYFLSSFIHMDILHCLLCTSQYMFMLPVYVNVLMVYAFCNIHDVTWGTKGDNVIVPVAEVKTQTNEEGKKVAVVDLPVETNDIDLAWNVTFKLISERKLKLKANLTAPEAAPNAQTKHDDFFKQYRTHVVLGWILSNMLLVFIFTSPSMLGLLFPSTKLNTSINPYLTFLFWSIAALSLVRFTFSTIYIVGWWDEFLRDSGKRRPWATSPRVSPENQGEKKEG